MTTHPIRSVLLTTYDRPLLLRQSLPQILEQSAEIGAELVIADDGSTDPLTVEMLARAARLPNVVVLPGERYREDWTSPDKRLAPVFSTGRRFLTAVEFLLARHPGGAFLKVDDDVFLVDGCFRTLADRWSLVADRAPTLSGMLDVYTDPRRDFAREVPGVVLTDWSSSVCCIHRGDLWAECIAALGRDHFVHHGWDVAFFWHWLNRRTHGMPLSLVPSLAYHTGHFGTRTRVDVNRRPPDPWAVRIPWESDHPTGVIIEPARGDHHVPTA